MEEGRLTKETKSISGIIVVVVLGVFHGGTMQSRADHLNLNLPKIAACHLPPNAEKISEMETIMHTELHLMIMHLINCA